MLAIASKCSKAWSALAEQDSKGLSALAEQIIDHIENELRMKLKSP